MKKTLLNGLLATALVIPVMGTNVLAAPNTDTCHKGDAKCVKVELSVQEKFNYLKDKGIFSGKADGNAHLDDKTTRAELATVLYLVNKLETIQQEKVTVGIDDGHWAKEMIVAVVSEGYMSVDDGEFRPNESVTVNELANVIEKAMSPKLIKVNKDKTVVKPVDSKVALRSDLVEAIYDLYQVKYFSLDPSLTIAAHSNGNYELIYKLKNVTNSDKVIGLSGKKFDYILYKDGEKVDQYSEGKQFILIYKETVLQPNEDYEVRTIIEDLEPGNYKIDFWLADKNWPNTKVTKEFTVK